MRQTRLTVLTLASLVTAAIHATVIREHLHEYVPFGAFFATLTAVEVVVAGLLARSPSRRVLALVAVGNLALALLWAATRTTGLPIGAERWAAEPVALKDAFCAATECVIAVGSVHTLLHPARAANCRCRLSDRSRCALSTIAENELPSSASRS